MLLIEIATELIGTAAVLSVVFMSAKAAAKDGDGPAGVVVRSLALLLVPAMVLAFAHMYFWPASLIVSIIIAIVLMRRAGLRDTEAPQQTFQWSIALIPPALAAVLFAVKAALSIASTPYDIDSVDYHLPMAIEFLQAHTAIPAQVMFHPGGSELLDSLGLGIQGAVGGQTLTEAVVGLAFIVAAYALARESGADHQVALAAAATAVSVPMVGDQLFTAQNDVLVATSLLAFVALWRRSPMLSAIAVGLAASVKFTGAVEAVALVPILWRLRSPKLSWLHVAVAALIGAPWYIRNAIETGNPFFLGGMSSGFSSTIVSNLGAAFPYVLLAVRNYGGLLAVFGAIAVAGLMRREPLKATLAPLLAALVAVTLLIWLVIPNAASSVPGMLDQIRPGWSIRYVLFAMVVLNVGAIVWIGCWNQNLAIAVAAIAVLATIAREYHATLGLDNGVGLFIIALVIAYLALVYGLFEGRRGRIVAGIGCLVLAVTSTQGAARIASNWNARFERPGILGYISIGSALSDATLRVPGAVGSINVAVLPLMAPAFEHYVIANESGLPPRQWWLQLEAAQPRVVLARDDVNGSMGADELMLRSSGHFREVTTIDRTRIYAAEP